MKKVTLSTIKSFLKKNEGQILIKVDSKFDSMTNCVERVNDGFTFAKKDNGVNSNHTLGLDGAWFVGKRPSVGAALHKFLVKRNVRYTKL